jgi:molecular chaperone GrpE
MSERKVAAAEESLLARTPSSEGKGKGERGDAAEWPVADERDSSSDGETAAEPIELDLEELAAKAAERDEYLALAQRTQADFENYRKRMAREAEAAQARGVTRLARELLPALDNLERGLTAAASAEAGADEQLIEGLRLVQRELLGALERAGIERYGQPGELFDPALHEAVAQQPSDVIEAGLIVEIYQAGYRLGAAVIRPARVLVAA